MPKIAIIGGSGLYSMEGLEIIEEREIRTPFGSPSDKILIGNLKGVALMFLARHSRKHNILPSEINSRANIWALKSLGAEWCISVSAVGSLKESYQPGELAIPDQLLDRTRGLRPGSFFGDGVVGHVSFAEPFCSVLRNKLIEACQQLEIKHHVSGTYVCMEGPAFSTRAESKFHQGLGASLIGMTAIPEAKLAREAELSYAILAMVTDYDCWKEEEVGVDASQVIETLKLNSKKAKDVLCTLLPELQKLSSPVIIGRALDNAIMTKLEDVPAARLRDLEPILRGYIARRKS